MDNEQKKPDVSESGSQWLDEILGSQEPTEELGPDLLAVTSARLTHPNDVELEKILAEDWSSVPDLEEPTIRVPEKPPVSEDPTIEVSTPIADVPLEDPTISVDEIIAEYSTTSADSPVLPAEAPTEEPIPAEVPAETPVEESPVPQGNTMFFSPVPEGQTDPEPSEEAPQEETSANSSPKPAPAMTRVRKIRPAPKKGYGLLAIPHILATFIWLGIILLIGLTLGHGLWSGITDLMAFGKPDQQVTITITESEVLVLPDNTKAVNATAIANKLQDAGLISNANWFELFSAGLTDKANDIDPGTYTLNSIFDYNAMINNMQSNTGARQEVEILIPEGYTCAQIFALLEQNDVCDAADIEAYLTKICKPDEDGSYALSDYWFLEGTPRNGKYWLEGYLFPDTYRFFIDDDPENVIRKFLTGFDNRFTDIMHQKLETIEERTGQDLTVHEIITIASMIEKESAGDADSYMISSVIYNRLNDPNHNWHLNIDATIYYALDGNIDPVTGLPKPLTDQDLALDHPYNTYKYTGLPPGPISNPGRNSMDAALTPEQEDYTFYLYENGTVKEVEKTSDYECLYYVYNPHDEVHIFSETESNHEKAKAYIKSLD